MTLEKILKNIKTTPTGCWEWQKSTNSAGYGQLKVNKKYWTAHRYALSCTTEVTETDVVRHKCHNRKCCNPDHLIVGTHKDNYEDSRDTHLIGSAKTRHKWSINGVSYTTCKEAVLLTGLPIATIIKHTKNGVFDLDAYRKNCKIANWKPKF